MTSDPPVLAVTVLGADRPGIVSDVTAALAGLGGNLEDSTMTLLRGQFAMVVLVRTTHPVSDLEQALAGLVVDGSLVVDVRAMPQTPPSGPGGAAFTLRVHGADRPGIVAAVTRVVAGHGATIVDLGTRLSRGLYVLTAELVLPADATPARLEQELAAAAESLGVDVHLDPVDDDLL
ncbi:ACT domain-containing protein [Dermatophilaceae bacterium Soc4.6]